MLVYTQQYIIVVISLGFALLIPCLLILFTFLLSATNITPDKISAYECGFNPFDDTSIAFEVKFYIVGVVFLIFDIEIAFVYPVVFALHSWNFPIIVNFLIFLVLLIAGLVYEWNLGILEWS